MFSWKFLNWKQAQKTANNYNRKTRKGEKGEAKKNNNKTEKLKDVGPFLVQNQKFDFRAYMYLSKIVLKAMLVEREACCHVARLFV